MCVCVCVCVCDVSVNNDNLVGEITSKSQDKAHAARTKWWVRSLSMDRSNEDDWQDFLERWNLTWSGIFMGEELWKAFEVLKKT